MSPGTVLNENSVKTKLNKTPSPILYCISQLGDNSGGQGYWVLQNSDEETSESDGKALKAKKKC